MSTQADLTRYLNTQRMFTKHDVYGTWYDMYGNDRMDDINEFMRRHRINPRTLTILADMMMDIDAYMHGSEGNDPYRVADHVRRRVRELEHHIGPHDPHWGSLQNPQFQAKPECQHPDVDEEDGIEFCPDCGKTGDDLCL